jgi:hypothetical protein
MRLPPKRDTFPVQMSPYLADRKGVPYVTSIPWDVLEPHRNQAAANHCGQTLEKLANRGGCSPEEIVAILEDRKWSEMDLKSAVERMLELVKTSA